MLADTSEGRISFEELYKMDQNDEELPYSFSFNKKTQMPELKQINKVWIAGKTRKLVRIHTDKGLELDTTLVHPYYLFDGTEIEAKDLKPGMRLRKIARGKNQYRSNRNIIYSDLGYLQYNS